MKPASIQFMLTLALAGPCLAGEKNWDAQLAWWIGKYPTSEIKGKQVNVLSVAPLEEVIEKTVPSKERQLLKIYGVETPIEAKSGFMVISQCKPHDCPSEFATVIVDLKKKRVWAGFFTRKEGQVSTRWYGNADDYSILPQEIRQEFLQRHGD